MDAEIVYAEEVDEGKGPHSGMDSALDAALEVLAQAGLPGGEGPPCRAELHAGYRQPIQLELRRARPQRDGSGALSRDLLHGRALHERGPALYRKANAPNATVGAFEEYLSYVITSGANWAGPIGTFRLVIDKGDTTLVSFCGDGVRKIGPTTFEMIAKDYMPRARH